MLREALPGLCWRSHAGCGLGSKAQPATVVPNRAIMLRVLGGRTSEQWISQYASSHRNPVNRACHTLGIPTHPSLHPAFRSRHFLPPVVAVRGGAISARMDLPIYRPCVRRQAAGVLPGLALPVRRRPLVVGKNSRQSLICHSLLPLPHRFSTPRFCSLANSSLAVRNVFACASAVSRIGSAYPPPSVITSGTPLPPASFITRRSAPTIPA